MSLRYYDNRDILINLLAGFLGVMTLYAVAGNSLYRRGPSDMPPRSKAVPDIVATRMVGVAVLGVVAVGTPPCDEGALAGTWERDGKCGVLEWVSFDGKGAFTWRDDQGNRAHGRYALRGNRLDGPLLDIACLRAENRSTCGFQPGFTANVYITFEEGRFFFNPDPGRPLILRSVASVSSHGRSP